MEIRFFQAHLIVILPRPSSHLAGSLEVTEITEIIKNLRSLIKKDLFRGTIKATAFWGSR